MDPLSFLIFILILKENSSLEEEKCADYAKDIDYHHPTISYTPPNPPGVWVSSRCELVPNPKYIMRRLDVQESKWTSYIYHYSDSWCTKPTFTVKIRGSYEMLPATATPNSKASYASIFHFTNVYFNSNSTKIIEDVINLILKECPTAISISTMQKRDIIDLDKYVNKDISLEVNALLSKKRCRYYFVLHPGAYRKVRMTGEKKGVPLKLTSEYDTLYFASILPFQLNKNRMDISQKFQYGLSRLNRPGCEVCQLVAKLNKPDTSPVLWTPKGRKNFGGGWVSKTCEATDDKTFQSNFYKFTYAEKRADKGIFIAQENFFSDSDCKIKKFNMKIGGRFGNVVAMKNVRGVYVVKLYFTSLSLTIYDDATISLVRNGGSLCGDPSKWRIGVEQNLTESKGCTLLGFGIPTSLKTLVRVSRTKSSQVLYISPIENEGTFFSTNYVSCGTVTENYKRRVTTTTPTPKKHVVPVVKDFDLDSSFNNNNNNNNKSSAISRKLQSTLICLMLSILYCVFCYV